MAHSLLKVSVVNNLYHQCLLLRQTQFYFQRLVVILKDVLKNGKKGDFSPRIFVIYLVLWSTFNAYYVLFSFYEGYCTHGASLVDQMVKNLLATPETQVQSLGWEDPPGKGMATHSSILVWRIPWTEEPGGLHSLFGGGVSLLWVEFTWKPMFLTNYSHRFSYF